MPLLRRLTVGLTVASGLAAVALAVPADAGTHHVEFAGVGRSTAAPGSGVLNSAPTPAGTPPVRETGPIHITGSVAGLYPGESLPLALTVTNARTTAVTVTSVTTTVGNASALCTKKNLQISAFKHGALVVPAGGHATVTVQATMALAAGNACQGVEFSLTYHGKATTR